MKPMIKKYFSVNLKALLSLVFLLNINQIKSEFILEKVQPETEKFVLDIINELKIKGYSYYGDLRIFHSDSLPSNLQYLMTDLVIPDYEKIYINERFFNILTLQEKRYLIGRAILFQSIYSKRTLDKFFYAPIFLTSYFSLFKLCTAVYKSFKNRKILKPVISLISIYALALWLPLLHLEFDHKQWKRISKAEDQAVSLLNCSEGRYLYNNRKNINTIKNS